MIGFVIIGRNEAESIARCIASIDHSGPVIYSDSASSDDSVAVARAGGAEAVVLSTDKPLGASRGRAEGYAALKAAHPEVEFVQFVDGDCEFEPGWIGTAAAFLTENADVAAVCGRRRERNPEASPYNRMIDREWDTPLGEAAACGGDSMMRSVALNEAGGFDPSLMAGEEPELCSRMRGKGWTIMRIDAPMTVHDAQILHLSQWMRRARRSGLGYAQAWRATAGGLYGRQIASAALWAGIIPLAIIVAVLLIDVRALWAIPLLYGTQALRMAWRSGPWAYDSWRMAIVTLLAKFQELAGILVGFAGPQPRSLIEYRKPVQ